MSIVMEGRRCILSKVSELTCSAATLPKHKYYLYLLYSAITLNLNKHLTVNVKKGHNKIKCFVMCINQFLLIEQDLWNKSINRVSFWTEFCNVIASSNFPPCRNHVNPMFTSRAHKASVMSIILFLSFLKYHFHKSVNFTVQTPVYVKTSIMYSMLSVFTPL